MVQLVWRLIRIMEEVSDMLRGIGIMIIFLIIAVSLINIGLRNIADKLEAQKSDNCVCVCDNI